MISIANTMITPELKKLRQHFLNAGFDIRFVGGCVRDSLLNVISNDIDLCTNANPDQQLEIYKNNNVYHYATGIEHGTITVELGFPRSEKYEITSLRVDKQTDGRHAEVEFTDDWTLDLSRRDFTINAMTLDFEGNLFDPFRGKLDLEDNKVVFVGYASDRIKEDYLRILRWYRFMGRYGKYIYDSSNYTVDVIKQNASGMEILSKERIWMEFKKILSHHSRDYVLKCMEKHGILEYIDIFHELENQCPEDVINPVTAMVSYFGKHASEIGTYWKWSRKEMFLANFLINNFGTNLDIMEGLAYYGYPREYMYELALLENRSDEDKNKIMTVEIPKFMVNGNDLMALGFSGKQIREELFRLKKIWKENNYK